VWRSKNTVGDKVFLRPTKSRKFARGRSERGCLILSRTVERFAPADYTTWISFTLIKRRYLKVDLGTSR